MEVSAKIKVAVSHLMSTQLSVHCQQSIKFSFFERYVLSSSTEYVFFCSFKLSIVAPEHEIVIIFLELTNFNFLIGASHGWSHGWSSLY